jgi:NhaA family Na+:H+ antiporter
VGLGRGGCRSGDPGQLNRLKVTRVTPYLLLGAALWWLLLKSGIHATLAGVALALTIPIGKSQDGHESAHSPLHKLEHALNPWVAYAIVPIFGFANAGVNLGATGIAALSAPSALGVAAGLFLGKQLGVFGFSALAIRLGVATRPTDANWSQLYGVSLLCGVGFTMSLFINNLAFRSAVLQDETKLGVLAGSLLSALAGWAVLALAAKKQPGDKTLTS